MTLLGLTGLINLIASFSLATLVWIKKPGDRVARSYARLDFAVGFFSLFYFLWQIVPHSFAGAAFKGLFVGIILINQTYLTFVTALTRRENENLDRTVRIVSTILNLIFVSLLFRNKIYGHIEPRFGLGLWPVPTRIFVWYLIVWHLQCFYGFSWLIYFHRNKPSKIFPLVIVACAIGYIGGASNWLMWFSVNFPPYLNGLIAVYVGMIAYAILKHRLMDIDLAMRDWAVYAISGSLTGLSFFGISFVLLAAHPVGACFAATLLTGLVTPIVFPWLKRILRPVARGKEYGYLENAAKKAKEIKLLDSLDEALPIAAEQILELFPSKSCSIVVRFTDQDHKPGARAIKVRAVDGNVIEAARLSDQIELELLNKIRSCGRLVVRDESEDLPPAVQMIDPWLFAAAIPLRAREEEIVGVILVGPKNNGTPLHDKDLEVLETVGEYVSDQLAAIISLYKFRLTVNNILHDAISNHLRGFLGKLELGLPLHESDTANMRKLNKLLVHLRGIAHDEIEAKGHDELSQVDIERLLNEILQSHQITAEQKGLKVILDIKPPLGKPRLDALIIDRVIGNLLSNAIKYTHSGKVTVSARSEKQYLFVSIADTGMGIPKELIHRIFEAGFRVPGKWVGLIEGSGTGLANVKELMLAIGGTVEVSSELGQGSVFTLKFPIPHEGNEQQLKQHA